MRSRSWRLADTPPETSYGLCVKVLGGSEGLFSQIFHHGILKAGDQVERLLVEVPGHRQESFRIPGLAFGQKPASLPTPLPAPQWPGCICMESRRSAAQRS